MFITDALALSHVPRWVIVPHTRPQSVADHSYRTACIAIDLARRLELELSREAIVAALFHDLHESRTGDIPSTAKAEIEERLGEPMDRHRAVLTETEAEILKLADVIEARTFIAMYGTMFHARRAANGLTNQIEHLCASRPGWYGTVNRLISDIEMERER